MFRVLQYLQSQGYFARITDGLLLVTRASICGIHSDIDPNEVFDYFELVLQDEFPKNKVSVTPKDDSWICVKVG